MVLHLFLRNNVDELVRSNLIRRQIASKSVLFTFLQGESNPIFLSPLRNELRFCFHPQLRFNFYHLMLWLFLLASEIVKLLFFCFHEQPE